MMLVDGRIPRYGGSLGKPLLWLYLAPRLRRSSLKLEFEFMLIDFPVWGRSDIS